MELTQKEWDTLQKMARYLLDTISGDIEMDGFVTVCDTLIDEEVELLKKIANGTT